MLATTPDVNCFTLVDNSDGRDIPSHNELKSALEHGKDDQKIEAMKHILLLMLNGDPCNGLLMHVIRFVMPSKSKPLKKLLLIYWEICPKTTAEGKLKQEMILVCNAIRNDLQHPNEYVRGATLRFLCKLREAEILEPLVPAVRTCLDHRHVYVRKNAILAIYTVYKNFEYLIPDAPELVYNYLLNEQDQTCKRNAFVMLINTKLPLAVQYFNAVYAQIATTFDELLQLAVIDLIRKDCKGDKPEKGKYIQCIFGLLNASSHSVKYEAATTLVSLTSHASAVKAAATCFIELIIKEADNNVKLIVLDRINELRESHERMLDDLVMDILRVLTSPDIDVRRKCLKIAMDLVNSRNVDEVVGFLKKELVKTHDPDYEKTNEYRQLLIHAIHSCAIKFSEVAASVVHVLMEFLGETSSGSAVDVIAFVREVMEKFPQLRVGIIEKLLEAFGDMKTGRVFRGALWIVGEYSLDPASIEHAMMQIRAALGEIPILASEQRSMEKTLEENAPTATANGIEDHPKKSLASPATGSSSSNNPASLNVSTHRKILADGTYATESAFSNTSPMVTSFGKDSKKPPLRALLLNGDFFLGSVLASSLTKLILRYSEVAPSIERLNGLRTEAMLIMTSIIRLGRSELPVSPMDEDAYDRVMSCLRILSASGDVDAQGEQALVKKVFLDECRNTYAELLKSDGYKRSVDKKNAILGKSSTKKPKAQVQVDDVITCRFLKTKKSLTDGANDFDLDLTRATGGNERGDDYMSRLSRVVQLTGFSDPVYAEAYVNVHQYDILLDVLIVNQTSETLQNMTLEFSTLGDLKLVERPTPITLGPRGFHSVKTHIKVSSTETGVIFGNIVYDGPGALETSCVILYDIHIDIMDYINPAYCSEQQFRSMWTEFEWENKVNVNTSITGLRAYLDHIMKSTNMACLTPEHALSGECGFLAANMYARSIFGEDALANICLEKQGESITGHIRIRSKTQGIALSLGDKITLSQKSGGVAGSHAGSAIAGITDSASR